MAMPQPTYATNGNGYPYPPGDASTLGSGKPAPELVLQYIPRTPSPTQSEYDFLNGVKKKRSMAQRIRTYLILAIIIVVIALIENYHEQIINGLSPVTHWLRRTKAAWLVPIAVLIVLSFPPLFGHEIVVMLCGIAWGLGKGSGIAAAGTIIGELCTFFVFKYGCGARARKSEATNMSYATLARVVREGGLVIPIIMRYSSMPAHFTTAVFATCGMPLWVFLVAAVVSLPKQLITVYIGVALNSSSSTSQKVQRICPGYYDCHHGACDDVHPPAEGSGQTRGCLRATKGAPSAAAGGGLKRTSMVCEWDGTDHSYLPKTAGDARLVL
ncbi:hypothetical protein DFH07DRAFT_96933 [Mycena maculata]|uniref:Golgi apparatus membrane protein TVP38 n=1 Tax=Mycena maculata TaxID=230809 RepID=A0AAD7I7C8_9AGAR|nr:hypothetical protein DFH07DRAFT_96933 [Mycena maculata]